MSERGKITIGQLQDECKKHGVCTALYAVPECPYLEVCPYQMGLKPENLDLRDPPRFNEAQMAFWRGWYAIGAKFVKRRFGTGCVDFSLTTADFCTSHSCVLPDEIAIKLEEGKAYDLAELLGKDGADEKD